MIFETVSLYNSHNIKVPVWTSNAPSLTEWQRQSTVTLWPNFDFSFQAVTAAPLINYLTWRGRDNQQAPRAEGLQLKSWSAVLWEQCRRWLLPYIVNKEAKILKTPGEHLSDDYLMLYWTVIRWVGVLSILPSEILTNVYIWMGHTYDLWPLLTFNQKSKPL